MGGAPVDPRDDLPAFGSLPTVARVDELATRVFTNGADADFVKRKYAETFQQVVAEATELSAGACLVVMVVYI